MARRSTLVVDDPFTGEVACELPLSTAEEALALVARAAQAQRTFARAPVAERAVLVQPFCEAFRAGKEGVAQDITRMMGKPVREAREEVETMIRRATHMASIAEEALARMNDSRYGLTASVWTSSEERAIELGRRLDAGTVFMNRCDYLDPALPWVGVKESGLGCTLSHLGLQALTRPKSYHLRTRTR